MISFDEATGTVSQQQYIRQLEDAISVKDTALATIGGFVATLGEKGHLDGIDGRPVIALLRQVHAAVYKTPENVRDRYTQLEQQLTRARRKVSNLRTQVRQLSKLWEAVVAGKVEAYRSQPAFTIDLQREPRGAKIESPFPTIDQQSLGDWRSVGAPWPESFVSASYDERVLR